MRLQNEQQLLDPAFRKSVIEEIESNENIRRKHEAFKRYECYKDKTKKYVLRKLAWQFDYDTLLEMMYAISNIPIVKKVVNKLARVYSDGVERELVDASDEEQEYFEQIEKETDINSNMKKLNRFLKLQKNCMLYIRPMKADMESEQKIIKISPLQPYLYDVIEQEDDREKPAVVILSDFNEQINATDYVVGDAAWANRGSGRSVRASVGGDGKDQTIADSPSDQMKHGDRDNKQYVWWSKNYHFVTNKNGDVISMNGEIENPVLTLPFVNFAEDQDGSYWAQGGDDLADGGILMNSMISHTNHISITQGYGQIVIKGEDKNIPRSIRVGPNKAIILPYQEGEAPTDFSFQSANPPIDQLIRLVEVYVALFLTTNNLSTSGVSTNLNGNQSFPSGIAMMIDKAESNEDVDDQRQLFIDNEPVMWDIYAKWHRLLKANNELTEELDKLTLPEDMEVTIKFNNHDAIMSEKERLEVMEKKLTMGIASKIDALRYEYPDLSDEQLKEKLEEILNEKLENAARFMNGRDQDNKDDSNRQQDGKPTGDQSTEADEGNRGRVPNRTDSPIGGREEESDNG